MEKITRYMNHSERIPIIRSEAGAIYGRIVGAGGRLGRYEVIMDFWGHLGTFAHFADAEREYNKYVAKANAKKN